MHSPVRRAIGAAATFLLTALVTIGVSAADLRIGLRADPDVLDPAQGVSVAGRVVFAAMCDKLIDTTTDGNYQPQLTTSWTWSADNLTLTQKLRDHVLFQDGQPMDAAAVKDQSRPLSRRSDF